MHNINLEPFISSVREHPHGACSHMCKRTTITFDNATGGLVTELHKAKEGNLKPLALLAAIEAAYEAAALTAANPAQFTMSILGRDHAGVRSAFQGMDEGNAAAASHFGLSVRALRVLMGTGSGWAMYGYCTGTDGCGYRYLSDCTVLMGAGSGWAPYCILDTVGYCFSCSERNRKYGTLFEMKSIRERDASNITN
jgi:hypothetical protein